MDTLNSNQKPAQDSQVRRGVVRWLLRETIGTVMLALLLFLTAGRWDWGMGWALVVITILWVAATALTVIPRNPRLLAERTGLKKSGKLWDLRILSIMGMFNLARSIIAGLDQRYGWTTGFPYSLQLIMLLIVVLGYALFVWAIAANAFFAMQVRIQEERGHTVATGGPYRFVRHPGYVGQILLELGAPLMLGSIWGLIPAGMIALLALLRTALEDRMLQKELPGYQAYAKQVRYRLLPGIW